MPDGKENDFTSTSHSLLGQCEHGRRLQAGAELNPE